MLPTNPGSDTPGELPLPPLRQDLKLIRGGAEGADDQRWKIHDPLSDQFYEVSQDVIDILSLWYLGQAQRIVDQLQRGLHHDIGLEAVAEVLEFLRQHELLQAQPGESYTRAADRIKAGKGRWFSKVLHGYLFFRVPLTRPARFLRATMPLASLFFQPLFWGITALAAMIGLFLVSRQWESFVTTLPQMFSVSGVVAFSLSLVVVKTLHELGHGYAATRSGVHVTTTGVAFIVMMPVLYTDTTDAWRLSSRRKRVLIDVAGIAVELIIAVYATLAWVFLPDGPVRYVVFALATTGWLVSLLVNVNPLMRFDGYYLFSDLVGVANLQERSFAMGRWWLREALFGYGDEIPEETTASRRRLFIGFAFAVWIYRFFLFLGIAVLVYHFFFKVLGLFLFLVEISWFIVLPISRELRVWWQRRRDVGRRVVVTLIVGLSVLAVLIVPIPLTVRVPAVLGSTEQYPVYTPHPARIEQVLVEVGARVVEGQPLVQLSDPELSQRIAAAVERRYLIKARLDRRSADQQDRAESLVLNSELVSVEQELDGLRREQQQLQLKSHINGVVVQRDDNLHPGRWVNDSTRLLLVAQPRTLVVQGYINSDDLNRVHPGQAGTFVDQQFVLPPLNIEIDEVAGAAADSLDNWMLASVHGGSVPSRMDGETAHAEGAEFALTAHVTGDTPTSLTELRGEMQFRGEPISLAARGFNQIIKVLLREMSA
ncbi:HlyD family efflux transporter periplasmic adaptor subunit [Halomonas cupida]|uniref:HlyD family efflux transporter periplasmic adaptor subunit n=1 Tax=Halomonas cupida TaxID=44933 RepID=UPI003A92F1B0